jgi:PAN domain
MRWVRCLLSMHPDGACLRLLLACLLLTLGLSALVARADVGVDRPGGDYTHFVLKSGDPGVCASRCEHDPRCRAWSFSYPTPQGAQAACWLKSSVPARVKSDCCVSGVQGAGVHAPASNDVEFGINRAGGDYKTLDIQPDSSGERCEATCKGEQRCRAWTYIRPGYQGASARCVLKEHVTIPRRDPCCLSGVVR